MDVRLKMTVAHSGTKGTKARLGLQVAAQWSLHKVVGSMDRTWVAVAVAVAAAAAAAVEGSFHTPARSVE